MIERAVAVLSGSISLHSRIALPAPKPLPECLLTVAEMAATLGLCRATIHKLCERGELPHVRVSNAIRFQPGAVEAFVAARSRPAG